MSLFAARMLRLLLVGAMLLVGLSTAGRAQLTTEESVQKALESQGYQEVHHVKFTSEGISAKAVKDGKPVSLLVDPTGKVMQRK